MRFSAALAGLASAGRGSRRAALAAPAVLMVLVLAGCSLLSTAPEREPEWAEDPDSGKFYRPGVVLPSQDLLEEHFPELEGVQEATLADGRFTDPNERVPIPAPDDYWWQAAASLEDEQVDQLLRALEEPDASDGGGLAPEPPTHTDEEVRAIFVPTIEAEVSPCSDGWVAVGEVLGTEDYQHRTAGGDMIQLAALCADTAELVVAANDM